MGFWMGQKKLLIERFPTIQCSFEAEMIKDVLSCLPAHDLSLLNWSMHQLDHGFSKKCRLARGCKPACAAFDDDLTCAWNIGSDYGHRACRGLKQNHWQTFPSGGEYESVGGLHPAQYILFKAKKADSGFEAEICGQLAEVAFARAAAGDYQPG